MRQNVSRLFATVMAGALFIALLWTAGAATDYVRVIRLSEKPLFCIEEGVDASGGTYDGLGYSFSIRNDIVPGSTSGTSYADFMIFGQKVETVALCTINVN